MNVQQPNPSGVTTLNCRTVTHTCVATGWLRNPAHQEFNCFNLHSMWCLEKDLRNTLYKHNGKYPILFKLPRYLVCLLFIVVVFFCFVFFFGGGGGSRNTVILFIKLTMVLCLFLFGL